MLNSRQPILFPFRSPRHSTFGVPPFTAASNPFPMVRTVISGVTKDSSGAPLGNCTVHLFRTMDDVLMYQTTSDGSGNFSFTCGLDNYYVVAYLPGSPDVAGVTVNTLHGVDA